MSYYRTYTCDKGHSTDADFGSHTTFEENVAKLKKVNALTCSCCGSVNVIFEVAKPRINRGNTEHQLEGDHIKTQFPRLAQEFVGHNFAQAMRDMHAGLTPDRIISGFATYEEANELTRDGIGPIYPVPKPDTYDA